MLINIRRLSKYQEVKIVEGATTIDLGLLDDDQRRELAGDFQAAIAGLLDGLEPLMMLDDHGNRSVFDDVDA